MDVQELVVRAVPQGVSDTVDGLGEMTDQVEDSTDQMDEQASSMADLSEQFAGAMDVAVAGLAVASGFLLSQVPVLGEAFDGLFAIVSAVAFQMDSVLRPVLSPLTDAFLNVADIIFQAEGAGGALIGTLGTLVTIFGAVVAPAAALASKLGLAASTGSALISAGSTLAGVITTIGAAIISLPGLIAVGIAALVAFIAAYLTNWNGARDKTNAIIGKIVDFVVSGFKNLVSSGGKLLNKFIDKAKEFGDNLLDTLTDKLADVGRLMFQFGKNIGLAMLRGVESIAQSIVDVLTNILNANISAINTIIDTLPDEVASRLSIDTVDKIEAPDVSGSVDKAVEEGSDFIGSIGSGRGTINLDGRDVENTQGRYRADNLHRRGG